MKVHMLFEIACELQRLHSTNTVYAHLHPKHCLISTEEGGKLKVRLADDISDDEALHNRAAYLAPEMFDEGRAGAGAAASTIHGDVFSFGILVNEVMTERRPYVGIINVFDIGDYILQNGRPAPMDDSTGGKAVATIKRLVNMCWARNPTHRPKMTKLVSYLQLVYDNMSLFVEES